MKLGLYYNLAKDGIRKNRRMYLPYILTCIGMVMMNYIILALQSNDVVTQMKGGANVQFILSFGSWVIAIFACIFLFYTNSFLIRRRKKEFGLYNILGMGRKNLGIILFFESLIIAVTAIVAGLFSGILFSKFAELGLINMLGADMDYALFLNVNAIVRCILIYSVLFLLLFINNLRQIYFSSTLSLMNSEKVGEKPVKANWLLAVIGLILLAFAYYKAATIENPMAAFSIFFIAVILVIIATYCIMIAGSVVICKLLQKNKKYYYKKNHFVSVSSMAYRMNRNGAGLASICILATMVLVMISSTSCLYFGNEDALNMRFSRDISCNVSFAKTEQLSKENIEKVENELLAVADECGIEPKNVYACRQASIAGALEENKLYTDVGAYGDKSVSKLAQVTMMVFVPIEDYNKASGKNITLDEGEALVHFKNKIEFDKLVIDEATEFKIKDQVEDSVLIENADAEIVPMMVLFVNDFEASMGKIKELQTDEGEGRLLCSYTYDFDVDTADEKQGELASLIDKKFKEKKLKDVSLYVESKEANRIDFYTTYAGFFYLGILLSVVFVFAAVLIIYYKQITEGYEDQARFDIMQKVGMTDTDIRKSINSQMLTVFYLPLVLAGLHVCFAFPVIQKLLLMFNLNNVGLFVKTSVISFVVFAVIYALVYRITSNAYYKIVRTDIK